MLLMHRANHGGHSQSYQNLLESNWFSNGFPCVSNWCSMGFPMVPKHAAPSCQAWADDSIWTLCAGMQLKPPLMFGTIKLGFLLGDLELSNFESLPILQNTSWQLAIWQLLQLRYLRMMAVLQALQPHKNYCIQHHSPPHLAKYLAIGIHRTPQESIGVHRKPWESIGIHRTPQDSTGIHRSPQESTGSHGNLLESIGLHRNPQGDPKKSIGIHRHPQEPIGIHGNLWESLGIHRTPQESAGIHRNPIESIGIQRNPQESIGNHRNPQEHKGIHRILAKCCQSPKRILLESIRIHWCSNGLPLVFHVFPTGFSIVWGFSKVRFCFFWLLQNPSHF